MSAAGGGIADFGFMLEGNFMDTILGEGMGVMTSWEGSSSSNDNAECGRGGDKGVTMRESGLALGSAGEICIS